MYLNGNDLLIYTDGQVVASAKSCRINMDTEIEEKSMPGGGSMKSFLPGRYEWQVTVNTLVTTAYKNFLDIGKVVRLTFVVRNGQTLTTDRMTGNAIITKSEVTGSTRSLTQGSFVFQGTGKLEQQTGVL